jgi:hypothetical protein
MATWPGYWHRNTIVSIPLTKSGDGTISGAKDYDLKGAEKRGQCRMHWPQKEA